MKTNRQMVDRFLRNPASPPKTYMDKYIDLLKQTNSNNQTDPAASKTSDSNQEVPNSGSQSFSNGGVIDPESETNWSSSHRKKISPFLIIGTVIALLVISVIYKHHNKKIKEREQAKELADEKINKKKVPGFLDDLLNSNAISTAKKVLSLIVIVFGIVGVLYALTLLIKQMRNIEKAAIG